MTIYGTVQATMTHPVMYTGRVGIWYIKVVNSGIQRGRNNDGYNSHQTPMCVGDSVSYTELNVSRHLVRRIHDSCCNLWNRF